MRGEGGGEESMSRNYSPRNGDSKLGLLEEMERGLSRGVYSSIFRGYAWSDKWS